MTNGLEPSTSNSLDFASFSAVIVTGLGWLPDVLAVIATFLSSVWLILRIYDWIRDKLKKE